MRVEVLPRDRFRLSGVVDIVALDRVAALEHRTTHDSSQLVLDLTSARFLDHEALLLIGGLVAYRKERGLRTLIDLPQDDRVLDFVRAWKFPEFLRDVAHPLRPLTPASEYALAARAQARSPRYVSFVWGPNGQKLPVTLLESLAITDISMTGDPWADASEATKRFLLRNIQSVIARTLGQRSCSKVADVVREAVLNATTHPHATMAYTSAHFRPLAVDAPDEIVDPLSKEFQLTIWDDGDSYADTLKQALRDNQPIMSESFGSEGVVFKIRVERTRDGFDSLELTDEALPDFDHHPRSDPTLLTCAAFMLGVSSDTVKAMFPENSTLPRARRRGAGIGLAVIRQAALDSHDGRIEYRSGSLRLQVQRDTAPRHYRFKVSVVPEGGWPIKGNLITVTIPLKERYAERQ